ncbi:hypothetical protein V2J09_008313 [Rumex salicifolius]
MHKPMEMESGLPPPPYGTAPPSASPQPLDPSYPPRSKPSSSTMFGVANLVLRSLTLVFLLIGLVVLAVDSVLLINGTTLHAGDVISYRYTISVAVIGILYTLVQIGFGIARLIMGAQKGKIMRTLSSYLLGTGAAAGFGASIDVKQVLDLGDFLNKGNSACSLVFMAFVFTIASSIISSYGLPKCSSCN